MPLEPRTTQQSLWVPPSFRARHRSRFDVGRILLLMLYCSSCCILDSRAVADMGPAAADSLPSSTVMQGTLLWKLESHYFHISTYHVQCQAYFYAQSGTVQAQENQLQATGEGLSLGSRRLSQATVFTNGVINKVSSYNRVRGSQFRLPYAVPLRYGPVLPSCSRCSLDAPPCSLGAPRCFPLLPWCSL